MCWSAVESYPAHRSAATRGGSPGAVAGCEVCPARGPCLAYALAADERDGIWGGLTRAERLQVLRADVA